MRQGVPENRFNVCEELMFSRTFRKNSTERNKQDLNSQLNDIFSTNQCYSFHIKDQDIVHQVNTPTLFENKPNDDNSCSVRISKFAVKGADINRR